jgi:GNAT superfamily N-acetyltransferase
MNVTTIRIDYHNEQHAADFKMLLNSYASDEMGGGQAIDAATLDRVPGELAKHPTAFTLISYVDSQPAAIANCFFGFSTFSARKLINIHDLAVLPTFRGKGLSGTLVEAIEEVGREHNCCKLTLEVLNKNIPAMNAYKKWGFGSYELDPTVGEAVFWQKKL